MIPNPKGHTLTTQERIGYAVGWLGIAGLVATVAFGIWIEYARPTQPHAFVYLPVVVFAGIGWWGFFWAIPKRATEGARVGVWISRNVRPGLREDDAPDTKVIPAAVVPQIDHGEGNEEGVTP
jgi:hypothetical protein